MLIHQHHEDARRLLALEGRLDSDAAPALEAAIDNRLQFESLAQAFIQLTVEHTRQHTFPDSLKKKTARVSSPRKRRSRS